MYVRRKSGAVFSSVWMNLQPYSPLPMSKHNRQLGTQALSIRLSRAEITRCCAAKSFFFFFLSSLTAKLSCRIRGTAHQSEDDRNGGGNSVQGRMIVARMRSLVRSMTNNKSSCNTTTHTGWRRFFRNVTGSYKIFKFLREHCRETG